MKTSYLSRIALTLLVSGIAWQGAGCHSPQHSASSAIAPNWYDSYYYKDGHLLVPNVPDSLPSVGPSGE